jgi:hypothetical protein
VHALIKAGKLRSFTVDGVVCVNQRDVHNRLLTHGKHNRARV